MRPPRRPGRPRSLGEAQPRTSGGEVRRASDPRAIDDIATAALSPDEARLLADPSNYPVVGQEERTPASQRTDVQRQTSTGHKRVAKNANDKAVQHGSVHMGTGEVARTKESHAPVPQPASESAVSAYESARRKMASSVASSRESEPDEISARRRERQAERRRLWGKRALVGLGSLVIALGVVWALFFSPLLGVKSANMQVTGISKDSSVSAADILESISEADGTSILRINVGKLATEIQDKVSLVKTATVSRDWPNGLTVDVTLRTPVACLVVDDSCVGLDSDGVQLELPQESADALPHLTTQNGEAPTSETMETMLVVLAALDSGTRSSVASIEVDENLQATLTLSGGATVLWGDTEDSDLKATVLKALMTQNAQYYDVSAPTAPVTR